MSTPSDLLLLISLDALHAVAVVVVVVAREQVGSDYMFRLDETTVIDALHDYHRCMHTTVLLLS